MKRSFLSIILIFMFTISCFAGCGNNGSSEPRVNFYIGETLYYTMQTTGNKVLQLPNDPSKQGFTFEGWFYDKDTWVNPFTKYDFTEKAITQNVNVYAKFRQNRINYNIRFYTYSNLYATVKTAGNETITLPQDPIKQNYTFAGWYYDDNTFEKPFTADAYALKKLAQDVNIYAKFTHNDGTIYKIVFVVENEEYSVIETAGNNALTTFPANPNKTDYIFMGWFFDKDKWEQPFDAYTYSQKYLTDNVTVYAYFKEPEPEKFTISFIVDDKVYSTLETAGHEGVTLPDNPAKLDYDFVGWYFDDVSFAKEFNYDYYENISLTENIQVYAKFVKKEVTVVDRFTITFSVDGATYATLQTLGNETLKLPDVPFKEDYTFDGWYFDDESFEQPLVESTFESSALTGNVTVYAKFIPDVYESDLEYKLSDDGTYYIVVGLGASVNAKNILIPNTYNDLPVKEIVGATYDEHFVKVYDGVFYESSVRKIKISANIEKIGRWAIARCFNLVKVEFEENSKLHTIEDLAFNYSQALTSITLPKGGNKITTICIL